jgi:hypothetical protein
MSESKEARTLLDALVQISRLIEAHQAELYCLRLERQRLQAELGATGYRAGERTQEDLPL